MNPIEIERTITFDDGLELRLRFFLTKEETERVVADYTRRIHVQHAFVPLCSGGPDPVGIPKGATVKPKGKAEERI